MQVRAKHIVSVLLALIVMVCSATIVLAADTRMSDTQSVEVRLVFSGTTAYCTAITTGANGTESITNGHLVLTDSKNTVIAEWTDISATGNYLIFSDSASGLVKGETYTLTFSAKVNRNGNSESVSNYVSKKC